MAIAPPKNAREGKRPLRSLHALSDLESETVIRAILQNELPEPHCLQ